MYAGIYLFNIDIIVDIHPVVCDITDGRTQSPQCIRYLLHDVDIRHN